MITKNSPRICIVQPNRSDIENIKQHLENPGFEISTATSVQKAKRFLMDNSVQSIILDVHMEDEKGWDLLHWISSEQPNAMVIVVTSQPTIPGGIDALKTGAIEYFSSSWDHGRFNQIFHALYKKLQSDSSGQKIGDEEGAEDSYGIITTSEVMKPVFHLINTAASSMETVLIQGESGTGKELIARAIHYKSKWNGEPFIPVNCSAIPENLLESELFGHIRGAFTGADRTREGFFQAAHGGTIFLDEIGDTSTNMQAKLLRVLEDKKIWKVGAREPDETSVRVIAATNKDLRQHARQGLFREDLFYRLNVISINVPPLRAREGDIEMLTEFFLPKFAREWDRPIPELSSEVWNIFYQYHWPGNIRELENTVKQIVLMSNENKKVMAGDLPRGIDLRHSGFNHRASRMASLEQVEKEHIAQVINFTDWNKSEAARILGITPKTLRSKLKKYDISRDGESVVAGYEY